MSAILFAAFTSNWMANMAIWVIVIAAIAALVLLFLRVAGWQPPPWFWHAIGIVAAALFIIFLIIVLVSFASAPGPMFGP